MLRAKKLVGIIISQEDWNPGQAIIDIQLKEPDTTPFDGEVRRVTLVDFGNVALRKSYKNIDGQDIAMLFHDQNFSSIKTWIGGHFAQEEKSEFEKSWFRRDDYEY